MRRRHVVRGLGVVGSVWLAGCGRDGSSTGGDDGDPFEVPPGDLLPPVGVLRDVLDLEWEPREEIETGLVERAQANAAYRVVDRESLIVNGVEVGAWTFADVDAARTRYDELPYHDGWGMKPGDVAVESLEGVIGSEREYRIVFRDANAVGGLAYRNPKSGNADHMRRSGRDLAVAMHRHWRA